jgi:hypothetical protein
MVGIPRAVASGEVGRGDSCVARGRGEQQYGLEGRTEGGGTGLCGEGKSILCSAGLRLRASSTIPILVVLLCLGPNKKGKNHPRAKVQGTNEHRATRRGREAGKRRSEGFKTGKNCLRQGNCEIGKGKQARCVVLVAELGRLLERTV